MSVVMISHLHHPNKLPALYLCPRRRVRGQTKRPTIVGHEVHKSRVGPATCVSIEHQYRRLTSRSITFRFQVVLHVMYTERHKQFNGHRAFGISATTPSIWEMLCVIFVYRGATLNDEMVVHSVIVDEGANTCVKSILRVT